MQYQHQLTGLSCWCRPAKTRKSPTPTQGPIWMTYSLFREQLADRTRCLSHKHCLHPPLPYTSWVYMVPMGHRCPFKCHGHPCRRLLGTVDLRCGEASWWCSHCHMQVTQPQQCSTACYLLATKQFCSSESLVTYVCASLSTIGGTLSSVLTSAVTAVASCSLW